MALSQTSVVSEYFTQNEFLVQSNQIFKKTCPPGVGRSM